jgi:hypothetical protein
LKALQITLAPNIWVGDQSTSISSLSNMLSNFTAQVIVNKNDPKCPLVIASALPLATGLVVAPEATLHEVSWVDGSMARLVALMAKEKYACQFWFTHKAINETVVLQTRPVRAPLLAAVEGRAVQGLSKGIFISCLFLIESASSFIFTSFSFHLFLFC